MSIFEPFKLEEPNYNTINIKKVYDIFPTSLRIKQLTSQQLLEFLESQIDDRDEQIEELLRRLAELLNEDRALNKATGTLTDFTTNLEKSLNDLINSTLENTAENASVSAAEQSGFTRVGNTLLFFKVNNDPNNTFIFNMNHTDENGKGIRESDLQTPNSIEFRNLGDTPLTFTKEEKWTSNDDNITRIVNGQSSYPTNTNVFNFNSLPGITGPGFTLGANESITSQVSLFYKSKDAYKNVGLRRSGETNTWFGNMFVNVDNNTANMGNMRLYRDKT